MSSIIDTPVDQMLRDRHANRLLTHADEYDESAVEFTLAGNPRRALYLERWSERTRIEAELASRPPALAPAEDALDRILAERLHAQRAAEVKAQAEYGR